MSKEGDLKKRIIDASGINLALFKYMQQRIQKHIDKLIKGEKPETRLILEPDLTKVQISLFAVFEILDEAKQKFPDIGKETNLTVSPFEMKAQDWFLKWFGDAEK